MFGHFLKWWQKVMTVQKKKDTLCLNNHPTSYRLAQYIVCFNFVLLFCFDFRIQLFQEMRRITLPLTEEYRKMSLSNGLTQMISVGQRYLLFLTLKFLQNAKYLIYLNILKECFVWKKRFYS